MRFLYPCALWAVLVMGPVVLGQQTAGPNQPSSRPASDDDELGQLDEVQLDLVRARTRQIEAETQKKKAEADLAVARAAAQQAPATDPPPSPAPQSSPPRQPSLEELERRVSSQTDRAQEAKEWVEQIRRDYPNLPPLPPAVERRIEGIRVQAEVNAGLRPGPRNFRLFNNGPPDPGSVYRELERIEGGRATIQAPPQLERFDTRSPGQTGPGPSPAPAGTQFFQRPAPLAQPAVVSPESRQQPVLVAPGGVVISPYASIRGVQPADVASASYDLKSGLLTLQMHIGKPLTCKLDPDDFAVALRSFFEHNVDPVLGMSVDEKKPGYFSVDYQGPLHKTRFGKQLYAIDELLGAILFNNEGSHRGPVTELIPRYADQVSESSQAMRISSRIYLRATRADFAVVDGQLVCKQVHSKVEVAAIGSDGEYQQESLLRLARSFDANFDGLVAKFSEFQEFRRLSECVAMAKWLARNKIALDWSYLKTRNVPEQDFPAYVSTARWDRLFNGRNLDGWTVDQPSSLFSTELKGARLTVKPLGTKAVALRSTVYGKNFDLRYIIETDGPVSFLAARYKIDGKAGAGPGGAVWIDTKGRRQVVEIYVRENKYTVLWPDGEKKGEITVPLSTSDPSVEFGIRVPAGSRLTLLAAARRSG